MISPSAVVIVVVDPSAILLTAIPAKSVVVPLAADRLPDPAAVIESVPSESSRAKVVVPAELMLKFCMSFSLSGIPLGYVTIDPSGLFIVQAGVPGAPSPFTNVPAALTPTPPGGTAI
jgi:hypothetical protein